MARLRADQVAAYAIGAGLAGTEVVATAVAIAGWSGSPHPGESGGDTDARGDLRLQSSVWGPSIGLWQIRSQHADTGTGRARDANQLTSPAFNARAMREISNNGADWGPWTVWRNGSYRVNMAQARVAAGAPASGVDLAGADAYTGQGSTAGPIDTGGTGFVDLLGVLARPGFWLRVGFGAVGVWLVVIGVGVVSRDTLGWASAVVPAGRVAKIVGAAQ